MGGGLRLVALPTAPLGAVTPPLRDLRPHRVLSRLADHSHTGIDLDFFGHLAYLEKDRQLMSDVENTMSPEQLIKLDAEIANLNAMTAKLNAENMKLFSESDKFKTEARWHLAVVASGATLAIVAFTKLFL